jgi:hypothetical protein
MIRTMLKKAASWFMHITSEKNICPLKGRSEKGNQLTKENRSTVNLLSRMTLPST